MVAQNKKAMGNVKEVSALEYLQMKGLRFIEKNYHCPFGEIDLIMQDHDEIVFIEVRSRKYDAFGTAVESIDYFKQQKLLKSATHYLHKKRLTDTTDCRFDVVGFSNNQIDWIKDAFSYE